MQRFYFDANSTTPPLPKVVETVKWAMTNFWGNPTSTHREGQLARNLLEEARNSIAERLAVMPEQIIFCSSATEALYLLFKGLSSTLKSKRTLVFPGEHSSCINQLHDWTDIRWMPSSCDGVHTVVQMAASNETGIIYKMPSISGAIRIKDAVQAWGKIALDFTDCDAAVLSGHKIGGPKGSAILWLHPKLPWTPVLKGPQERRRRGGTENLAAILGLAEAVLALPERLLLNSSLSSLRDSFEAEIMSWSSEYSVIGRDLPRLPNTSSLLLRHHVGENIQISLDLAGFAVSTGSACHSGSVEPSHAIIAMGFTAEEAKAVLRVSMLPETNKTELEALLLALKKILKR
jgi:cysteine desulfurase